MEVIAKEDIVIRDYTKEIAADLEQRLTFKNPEYYKRLSTGRWTGNTPENISLLQRNGNDLIVPFGMLPYIFERRKDFAAIYNGFDGRLEGSTRLDYKSSIIPYPYQSEAIEAALSARQGVIVAPCGGGKTQIGLEIAARIGGRTLWLTHTTDLLNQSMERAKANFGLSGNDYGTITAGKVDIGTVITFATVQTMSRIDLSKLRDCFDVVICDECFPCYEKVLTIDGEKELRSIKNGDMIASCSRETGEVEYRPVTHVFRRKAHGLLSVKLKGGKRIYCTPHHPFFTKERGWIPAIDLRSEDYVMQLVRERSRPRILDELSMEEQDGGLSAVWQNLLFRRLFKKVSGKSFVGNNGENEQEVCEGEDAKEKSDGKSRNKGKGLAKTERNWTQAVREGRERNGAYNPTGKIDKRSSVKKSGFCSSRGLSDTDKDEKRFRISDLLQGGYCISRRNACNRNRRKFTLRNCEEGARQEERRFFEWVGVDCIEVQKQTSDGTFGGLCPDSYVYNLEVAKNHNYFVDGILVHNCHHVVGSPTQVMMFYKVISSLCARYKFGLTATPKRADGLSPCMFAMLGRKVYEISREDVKDTTCPVNVVIRKTDYIPDMDKILMPDGTLNYQRLINDVVYCGARNDAIVKDVANAGGTCLVLTERVAHVELLAKKLERLGIPVATLSAATGKKAKAERETTLLALNNKCIKVVVATYQLAKEGLDVPTLDNLFMATPQKNETVVTQSAGRVGRKAPEKDCGILYDYEDAFSMLKGWQKKRTSIYKKLGYSVNE